MGATVFGYIIGSTTSLVANSDAASAQLQERLNTLNEYMKDRRLPRELQVGIRKYFKYLWSRRTVFSAEEDILKDLSTPLRTKLLRFMHRDVLDQVPLFDVCNEYGSRRERANPARDSMRPSADGAPSSRLCPRRASCGSFAKRCCGQRGTRRPSDVLVVRMPLCSAVPASSTSSSVR